MSYHVLRCQPDPIYFHMISKRERERGQEILWLSSSSSSSLFVFTVYYLIIIIISVYHVTVFFWIRIWINWNEKKFVTLSCWDSTLIHLHLNSTWTDYSRFWLVSWTFLLTFPFTEKLSTIKLRFRIRFILISFYFVSFSLIVQLIYHHHLLSICIVIIPSGLIKMQ